MLTSYAATASEAQFPGPVSQTSPMTGEMSGPDNFVIELLDMAERVNEMLESQLRKAGFAGLKPNYAITLHRMGERSWRGSELVELWLGVGSITYPLRKLASLDMVTVTRARDDARAIAVQRTEKGRAVAALVERTLSRQAAFIAGNASSALITAVATRETDPLIDNLKRMFAGERAGES